MPEPGSCVRRVEEHGSYGGIPCFRHGLVLGFMAGKHCRLGDNGFTGVGQCRAVLEDMCHVRLRVTAEGALSCFVAVELCHFVWCRQGACARKVLEAG